MLALSAWYYSSLRRQVRAYKTAAAEERAPAELLLELDDPRMLTIDGHSLIDARPGLGSLVAVQKRPEIEALLDEPGVIEHQPHVPFLPRRRLRQHVRTEL